MTLDGIDKTYFNASADGLISDKPGILKLKKHPDSANQTVYIKTSKSQINLDDKVLKQPTFNVTDDASASSAATSQKKASDQGRKSSSPAKAIKTLEERRESINRSVPSSAAPAPSEKPKAMVAPLRNSTSTPNNTSR